jgi:hypothetical protein
MPWFRAKAESLGLKKPLKYVYRSMRGDPIVKADANPNAFQPPAEAKPLALPSGAKPTLLVVVDTEENFDWNAAYSSSSTAVHGMRQIARLQASFDRFGIKPIYLIDYAVASQPEGYGSLAEIARSGRCEIGAHLHPWVNPPVTEEVCVRNTYPCNLPPELEAKKLRELTAAIEANLGVRPVSYKAGRYGIGAATPGILREQGYHIDLSVVPTRDYSSDGGPDFRAFHDTRPFWIDHEGGLLELPFTTSFIGSLSNQGGSLFREINGGMGKALHLPGVFARLGLMNQVNLTPEGVTLNEAKALTRHLLANGDRVFTLAFHSTSLTPGSTPYVKDGAQLEKFYAWLEAYFGFFAGEIGGVFMTPRALYEAAGGRVPATAAPQAAE